jgi:hypothetical protein
MQKSITFRQASCIINWYSPKMKSHKFPDARTPVSFYKLGNNRHHCSGDDMTKNISKLKFNELLNTWQGS